MFQFPACPPAKLCIHFAVTASSTAGFPHSDICGSMLACSSPQLFAAGHVLLRRMVPGHPPCALCSLIFSSRSPETNYFSFLPSFYSWPVWLRDLSRSPYPLQPVFSNRFFTHVQLSRCVPSMENGVGRSGLEPPTSRLSGVCSNQLS